MNKFYIEPIKIAKKLNIEVKKIKLTELNKNWSTDYKNIPDNLCGCIETDDNKKVTIYYNPNHSENRIRFTIAHELGHFLLGHLDNESQYIDFVNNFKNTNSNPKEIESNKVAVKLLIPEDRLEFLIFKKGITSIKELAKIMRVSEAAMLYRLINLGWIRRN